jgi:uncharacterized membrane protein
MRSLTQVIASTMFCLAVSPMLFAPEYRFVKIDVPGSSSTQARGINARGDIVGSYDDSEGLSHGFLLRNGVFSVVDFPGDVVTLGARAINARGDIIGNFLDAGSVVHGYLLREGQFTKIDFPGAAVSVASGINNAGDVTGQYDDASGNTNGFLLKDGQFQSVHIPNSLITGVFSAQDGGRVFVGQVQMRPDGAFLGFVRDASGRVHPIKFPAQTVSCTFLRWINHRGDMVGLFDFVTTVEECMNDTRHGFLLQDGNYTRIDVPGATGTATLGINDDRVIVGRFRDKDGAMHGFQATQRN